MPDGAIVRDGATKSLRTGYVPGLLESELLHPRDDLRRQSQASSFAKNRSQRAEGTSAREGHCSAWTSQPPTASTRSSNASQVIRSRPLMVTRR